MKIIIPFLIILLCCSCNSGDSNNKSNELAKLGKEKLDKAKKVANLNKDEVNEIPKLTFEEQLQELQKLGVKLNQDVDIQDIFDGEFGKADYDEFGILFTLRELGNPKYKKDRGRVAFAENVYTLVSEDFNIDESEFLDLFENISRITNQSIEFSDIQFKNYDNTNPKKGVSFKIDNELISWDFDYNEGYFDTNLLESLCQLLKKREIKSLFWSQDGLSHTILAGDSEFINKMSIYLAKEPC